jgi:hypothetical protein
MKKYIKQEGDEQFFYVSDIQRKLKPLKKEIFYCNNDPEDCYRYPFMRQGDKYTIELVRQNLYINSEGFLERSSLCQLLIRLYGSDSYAFYILEEDLRYFKIGKHLLIEKVGGFYR